MLLLRPARAQGPAGHNSDGTYRASQVQDAIPETEPQHGHFMDAHIPTCIKPTNIHKLSLPLDIEHPKSPPLNPFLSIRAGGTSKRLSRSCFSPPLPPPPLLESLHFFLGSRIGFVLNPKPHFSHAQTTPDTNLSPSALAAGPFPFICGIDHSTEPILTSLPTNLWIHCWFMVLARLFLCHNETIAGPSALKPDKLLSSPQNSKNWQGTLQACELDMVFVQSRNKTLEAVRLL